MEALKIVQVYALYWKSFDHNFGQNSLSSFLICTMPQKDFDHCQMEFIFDCQSSSHKQDKKKLTKLFILKTMIGSCFCSRFECWKEISRFRLKINVTLSSYVEKELSDGNQL